MHSLVRDSAVNVCILSGITGITALGYQTDGLGPESLRFVRTYISAKASCKLGSEDSAQCLIGIQTLSVVWCCLRPRDAGVGNSRETGHPTPETQQLPHTLGNNNASLPRSSPAWRYRPTKGCFSNSPRTFLDKKKKYATLTTRAFFFWFRRCRPEDTEEASLPSSTFTPNSPRDQLLRRALEG